MYLMKVIAEMSRASLIRYLRYLMKVIAEMSRASLIRYLRYIEEGQTI
jgi:hypothetical protein